MWVDFKIITPNQGVQIVHCVIPLTSFPLNSVNSMVPERSAGTGNNIGMGQPEGSSNDTERLVEVMALLVTLTVTC